MQFWRPLTGELTGWMARKADLLDRQDQYLDDVIHRLNGGFMPAPFGVAIPPMHDDLHEYRYEQRGSEYRLRCWHNGTERTYSGLVDNTPEWLRAILATAKVAGAIRAIKQPPPEVILWFRTDDNHHLVEFIEMT